MNYAMDIGCGHQKRGVIGVDKIKTECTDYVVDLDKTIVPIMGGTVDSIVCNHMIEHMRYPKKLLFEASRLLVPGGFIDITLPHPSNFNTMWGHMDHVRPLPIEWFRLYAKESKLVIDNYDLHYFMFGEFEHIWWKKALADLVGSITNGCFQHIIERVGVYWIGGYDEMMVRLIKK